jgi:hypothetical protein
MRIHFYSLWFKIQYIFMGVKRALKAQSPVQVMILRD